MSLASRRLSHKMQREEVQLDANAVPFGSNALPNLAAPSFLSLFSFRFGRKSLLNRTASPLAFFSSVLSSMSRCFELLGYNACGIEKEQRVGWGQLGPYGRFKVFVKSAKGKYYAIRKKQRR
jgi:hypothetical protein